MGNLVADELIRFVPKSISVADVYVPYCFLNGDKLKIEKRTVNCDFKGKTYFTSGEKHEIVTDLDFEHFQEYLKIYLK